MAEIKKLTETEKQTELLLVIITASKGGNDKLVKETIKRAKEAGFEINFAEDARV